MDFDFLTKNVCDFFSLKNENIEITVINNIYKCHSFGTFGHKIG